MSARDQMSATARTKPIRARARTPKQLERQERVFALSVLEGKTVRQIAAVMEIALETVISDLRHEAERRAGELAERREIEQASQLAKIEDLYQHSIALRTVPGTGALAAAGKALEMRGKILGLEAATKIDIGLQTLLEGLEPKA